MRKYLYKVAGVFSGMKFHLIALSLPVIVSMADVAHAQTAGSVGGRVLDEGGNPIIGATVAVKGTMNAAITDPAGEFSLAGVNTADGVLVFSYLGYRPLEMAVGGRSRVDVSMQPDVNHLDDVIVVGYGSLARKELSSSIVQIGNDNFNQGAVSNPMEMLQGKVAGLTIGGTSPADMSSSPNLQIRGAASLRAGNSPLVIVDGVQGGSLQAISQQDIESISVLKDAASTAIYGTRGANGVIIITTKKGGGADGLNVIYDSYYSINVETTRQRFLTADEFRRSRRGGDLGASTDWHEIMKNPNLPYNHNQYLSLNGSSKNGSYGMSVNWRDAEGTGIKGSRREWGGRFNVEQRMIDNRLQLNGTLNIRRVNEIPNVGGGHYDTNPTEPVYNEDGTFYQPTSPTGASNRYAEAMLNKEENARLYAMAVAGARLSIIQNANHSLNTTLTYSMNYNDRKYNQYVNSKAADSYWNNYKGRARLEYSKNWSDRVEWLANYTMDIGDHSLAAVAGYNWEAEHSENFYAQNNDFAFDSTLWNDIGSGAWLQDGRADMGSGKSLSKLVGVFGRVNYNWKDLLMGSVAFRYEGSTKFGVNNKFGMFPSASVAWEIANMSFMESHRDIVNSLKLRASYGVSGRSGIDSYLSLSTYEALNLNDQDIHYNMDGVWMSGYSPGINPNPDLKWERSKDSNIGVDFVLWNRLSGSLDLYDRQSVDLLYNYTAPQPPFLHNSILVNVGTIRNRGVELMLDYDVFERGKPVRWNTGVIWSTGQTRLTKLSSDVFKMAYLEVGARGGLGASDYFFRVEEGAKIGQFYGYEATGLDEYGAILVRNENNEIIPIASARPEDRRYIGNGTPKHYLSWSNRFEYKNFDLSFLFSGAFGHYIYNEQKAGPGYPGAAHNVLTIAYTDNFALKNTGGLVTSYFLEKGDYFKLENATLGYNFRIANRKYVDNLRLYVSARNIYTFTGYSGNDPALVRQDGIEPGRDGGLSSRFMGITFGATLRFK